MSDAQTGEHEEPSDMKNGSRTVEIRPFDAAEHLKGDEEAQIFLIRDAIESGHAGYIANAIGAVARARGGLSSLERATGMKRQSLNKALGPHGNPTLETLLPVLKALGLRLSVEDVGKEPELAQA
jgi:probable addiction module antidote protein